MPLIDRSVKSGTGKERKKRWGVDWRNDIGPDPCPPWASSPNVVGDAVCATVPPYCISFVFQFRALGKHQAQCFFHWPETRSKVRGPASDLHNNRNPTSYIMNSNVSKGSSSLWHFTMQILYNNCLCDEIKERMALTSSQS